MKAAYVIGALAIMGICKANHKSDKTFEMPDKMWQLSFLPSRPSILTTVLNNGKITFLDTVTGKYTRKPFGDISYFALSTDGTKLATFKDTKIKMWDISNLKKPILQKEWTKEKHTLNDVIAFADNDTKLIMNDFAQAHIVFLDVENGKPIGKPIKLWHQDIALNSSTNVLASMHHLERTIKIYTVDIDNQKLSPAMKVISLKNSIPKKLLPLKLRMNATGSALGFTTFYSDAGTLKSGPTYLINGLNSDHPTKVVLKGRSSGFAFGQDNLRKTIATASGKRIHLWHQEMLTLKELVVQFILKKKINTTGIPPLLLKIQK